MSKVSLLKQKELLIRHIDEIEELVANDGCKLKEVLHPFRPFGEFAAVRTSFALAMLEPGRKTVPHRLLTSSELYFIIEGKARMHVGDLEENIEKGSLVYVPPGSVQWIENIGDDELKFIVVCDPAWREEDEELMAHRPSGDR